MDKEILNIEAEYWNSITSDAWKTTRAMSLICDKKAINNRFIAGNEMTLSQIPKKLGVDVSLLVWKFFNNYYSSNIMKLSIIGTESIEDLEWMAHEYFSSIKNLHLKGFHYRPQPYVNFPKGRAIKMVSSSKVNWLIVLYYLESLIDE